MFTLGNLTEQFAPGAPVAEAIQLVLGGNLALWLDLTGDMMTQVIPKQCLMTTVRLLDRAAGKLEKVQELTEEAAAAERARMLSALESVAKRHRVSAVRTC